MAILKRFDKVLSLALKKKGLISRSDTSIIFYDLSLINHKIESLKNFFPLTSLHTAAIKANPLFNVLKLISKTGFGAEVASLPELYLAQKAGFPSNKIVFDSPVKTN